MNLRPDEISSIIKNQIKNYQSRLELSDVGKKSKDECVPFPITDIARFDNMDMIIISGDALEAGRWLFQDWDKYGK